MKNKALKITGTTEEQYKKWCIDNNKKYLSLESKREFFKKALSGEFNEKKN